MAKSKVGEWLEPEKLILIEGWARAGLTDAQIAQNMGISRETLNQWRKKHPDISDTLKKGKEVADFQVENALFKSACGYEYNEITQEPLLNEEGKRALDNKGNPIMVVSKVVTKHAQPNATSLIYWLKNRMPEEWRDKIKLEHNAEELPPKLQNALAQLTADDG